MHGRILEEQMADRGVSMNRLNQLEVLIALVCSSDYWPKMLR